MSEKTKVTTNQDGAAVNTEPTFKKFEYGDLQMHCSHCGHSEVVEKGIKDGLQFVLPTTDEHKLKLACSKCGISLMMNFKESDEETQKESKEKYEAWQKEQEELKAKAEETVEEVETTLEELVEETEDALLREDTDKEPVQEDN